MPKDLSFFDQVYAVVQLVPRGRVTTYGHIARYLGAKRGARMVGHAMNASHTNPDVPAHRVVNASGLLTGRHHFHTPTAMQEALEAEGLTIIDHQVQDFDTRLWDPAIELAL